MSLPLFYPTSPLKRQALDDLTSLPDRERSKSERAVIIVKKWYCFLMPHLNPAPEEICRTLHNIHTIAVVGLSPNPARPSHGVARAMQAHGYRIVPVRPKVNQVLGEPAFPDLASIPFAVDLVDVFRAPQFVPEIVENCIQNGIPRLWLQDGVIHQDAAQHAHDAGIWVVMDRCIWRDFNQLCQ